MPCPQEHGHKAYTGSWPKTERTAPELNLAHTAYLRQGLRLGPSHDLFRAGLISCTPISRSTRVALQGPRHTHVHIVCMCVHAQSIILLTEAHEDTCLVSHLGLILFSSSCLLIQGQGKGPFPHCSPSTWLSHLGFLLM